LSYYSQGFHLIVIKVSRLSGILGREGKEPKGDKMDWMTTIKEWPENFECSDAGRKDYFPNEKNDCTVRAYSLAFDIPYYQAHKELKDFGRKDRHGTKAQRFFEGKGITVTAHKGTVKRFLKEHSEGVYIVRIRHHVFTVKSGKVFDTFFDYEGARVTWFIKVK
jgi:hypothetical protein